LAQKIFSMFNDGEPPLIEDLIGEPPKYNDKIAPVPMDETESEKQWIEWAKRNGHSVERTSSGLKIKKSL